MDQLANQCFSAHLTDQVKEAFTHFNTTIVVIPGGCTSLLQPLDVSINKPVEAVIQRSWEQYMLEQSEKSDGKISPPSKQVIVNWIEDANSKLHSNSTIVKKSFLVTGLSNSLGGHEDYLIRDDHTRREIEKVITEVFGEEDMGLKPHDDQSDHDPFDSDDSSSEKMDTHSESDIDDIDLDRENKSDSVMSSPSTPEVSDVDSELAPEFEDISEDDYSC